MGNHKNLEKMILKSWEVKRALHIKGTIGIGKSQKVKEVAKKIAKKENKEFTEDWENVNNEEKFVFIDLRASQMDSSDIKGFPTIQDLITKWTKNEFLAEKGYGIIFADELNLAPPLVQASFYQLILDRRIGKYKLSDNWLIIGAGNSIEDKCYTFEMAAALRNRFRHYKLDIPAISDWIDWAIDNSMDSRIISFLSWKPSNLFKFEKNLKDDSFPTPRSWQFCSDDIKNETEYSDLRLFAESAIGEGIAQEFVSFLKLSEKFNIEDVLSGKVNLPEEIDLKYSLISSLVDYYRAKNKKDKELFEKILLVAKKFKEPEFFMLLIRQVKNTMPDGKFKDKILDLKDKNPDLLSDILEVVEKYL